MVDLRNMVIFFKIDHISKDIYHLYVQHMNVSIRFQEYRSIVYYF